MSLLPTYKHTYIQSYALPVLYHDGVVYVVSVGLKKIRGFAVTLDRKYLRKETGTVTVRKILKPPKTEFRELEVESRAISFLL